MGKADRRLTVNRSPHGHKKAREQFQRKTYEVRVSGARRTRPGARVKIKFSKA